MTNTDNRSGYRKPPLSGRFKAGVSGNPRGRPKREAPDIAEIIRDALDAPQQYRDKGRTKNATREKVFLTTLINKAVAGDLTAAADVIKYRAQAQRSGGAKQERLEVINWLPEHRGQTGAQITEELSRRRIAGTNVFGPRLETNPALHRPKPKSE